MTVALQPDTIRDQVIRIRASLQQRDLIDRAARVLGKSRSAFVRETACREAEQVVLDQTFFQLDPETFDRFNEVLDNPPPPSGALRKHLLTKPPWE
jgi:uncharacterized protein (DUF1778 family)